MSTVLQYLHQAIAVLLPIPRALRNKHSYFLVFKIVEKCQTRIRPL